MKLEQFMLLKLAEECNEVAKRAIKQIQFGPNQSQSQDGLSPEKVHAPNRERLREGILDVFSIVKALIELEEIDGIYDADMYSAYNAKTNKIIEYLNY